MTVSREMTLFVTVEKWILRLFSYNHLLKKQAEKLRPDEFFFTFEFLQRLNCIVAPSRYEKIRKIATFWKISPNLDLKAVSFLFEMRLGDGIFNYF